MNSQHERVKRVRGRRAGRTSLTIEPARGINLRLLGWIQRRGGRVTVREIVRSRVACRTAAEAEDRLQCLLRAGLGTWEYLPMRPQGGRPTRQFVLNDAGFCIPPAVKLGPAHDVTGSETRRVFVGRLMAVVNRFERVPCRDLAEGAEKVADILRDLQDYPSEALFPWVRRYIRIRPGKRVYTTWRAP